MAKFELRDGHIFLNGIDISGIATGFEITSAATAFGRNILLCDVVLDCISNVEIETEAVVHFRMPDGKRYRLKDE